MDYRPQSTPEVGYVKPSADSRPKVAQQSPDRIEFRHPRAARGEGCCLFGLLLPLAIGGMTTMVMSLGKGDLRSAAFGCMLCLFAIPVARGLIGYTYTYGWTLTPDRLLVETRKFRGSMLSEYPRADFTALYLDINKQDESRVWIRTGSGDLLAVYWDDFEAARAIADRISVLIAMPWMLAVIPASSGTGGSDSIRLSSRAGLVNRLRSNSLETSIDERKVPGREYLSGQINRTRGKVLEIIARPRFIFDVQIGQLVCEDPVSGVRMCPLAEITGYQINQLEDGRMMGSEESSNLYRYSYQINARLASGEVMPIKASKSTDFQKTPRSAALREAEWTVDLLTRYVGAFSQRQPPSYQ
ncbi:MAG: hypothetical protein ACLQVD_07635 [Capsulimonadaceae bacterium]